MDASMLAQPSPLDVRPPSTPEEMQQRTQQWLQVMQSPQVQQEVQRYKAMQGLMGFGSRLTQNIGMGVPGVAAFGNAVGAGMDVMNDVDRELLKNSMSIAKQQSGEDEARMQRMQVGQQQAETGRHQREQERLTARGQDMQLQAARLYAARGAGGGSAADKYQALAALDKRAEEIAGVRPAEKDFTDMDGTLNAAAFEAALFRWGQRFAMAKEELAASGRYGNIWGKGAGKPAEMETRVGKPGRAVGTPADFEKGSLTALSPFEAPSPGSMQVKGGEKQKVAPPAASAPMPGQAMGMDLSTLEAQVDPATAMRLKLQAQVMSISRPEDAGALYEQLLREHLIATAPGSSAPTGFVNRLWEGLTK